MPSKEVIGQKDNGSEFRIMKLSVLWPDIVAFFIKVNEVIMSLNFCFMERDIWRSNRIIHFLSVSYTRRPKIFPAYIFFS